MGVLETLGAILVIAFFWAIRRYFLPDTKVYYFESGGFGKKKLTGKRVIGPDDLMNTIGKGGEVHFSKDFLYTMGPHNTNFSKIDTGERSIKDAVAIVHGGYILAWPFFNNIHTCWLEFDEDDFIEIDRSEAEKRKRMRR